MNTSLRLNKRSSCDENTDRLEYSFSFDLFQSNVARFPKLNPELLQKLEDKFIEVLDEFLYEEVDE